MEAWIGNVTDVDTDNFEAAVYLPEVDYQTGPMPIVNGGGLPEPGDTVAVMLSESSDYDGIILGLIQASKKVYINANVVIKGNIRHEGNMTRKGKTTYDGDLSLAGKLKTQNAVVEQK